MSLSNETDSPSDASGPLFSPFSHHNSESGDETTLSSPTVFSNNTVDNVRNPRSETERYSSVLQGLGRSPDPTPLDTHFQTPVSCHNRVLEACHARIAALEKANENLRVMVQQVNTVAQEARQTSKETAESLEINIESMEKDLGENVMPKIKNLQFRAMQTERNVEILATGRSPSFLHRTNFASTRFVTPKELYGVRRSPQESQASASEASSTSDSASPQVDYSAMMPDRNPDTP